MLRIRAFRILPVVGAVLLAVLTACQPVATAGEIVRLPAPVVDAKTAPGAHHEVAGLAGGCFWGIEAVFEHVKGVRKVTAGYSGGDADTAHYDMVGMGTTGHAESVKVEFDPSQVSYGTLLQVFFSVALNPTELDRQGPDRGTQYRSVVFYGDAGQKKIASDYIADRKSTRLNSSHHSISYAVFCLKKTKEPMGIPSVLPVVDDCSSVTHDRSNA